MSLEITSLLKLLFHIRRSKPYQENQIMVVSLPAFAPTHMGNLYFLRSGCSILCCGLKYLITQADKPEILSQQIICWALALAPVSFAAMIGIFRESRVCISKFKVL